MRQAAKQGAAAAVAQRVPIDPGSLLASTLGASAAADLLRHSAERPVRWAAGTVYGKAVELVITLLLVVSTTGCMATFASRNPEEHFDLRGRPSLYVSVTSEMLQLNNADQRVPLLFDPDYSDDVIGALRACDCFAAIDTTAGPHDLEASIRVSRVVHNKSSLLNLATAMVIPAVEDRRISIQVSVRDSNSNAEAKAERIRDFRVWYQLFLLPVYPFRSPAAFETKLFPQLVREAVAEAIARVRVPAARQGAAAAGQQRVPIGVW